MGKSSHKACDIETLSSVLYYEASTGFIYSRKTSKPVGYEVTKKRKKYIKVYVPVIGSAFYAHRIAYAIHYGAWPEGEVDHINGDSTDNAISNLRDVGRKENCRNVRIQHNSRSGFTGVTWHSPSGKWRARVKVDGSEIYAGLFTKPSDAADKIMEIRKHLGFHENHGSG